MYKKLMGLLLIIFIFMGIVACNNNDNDENQDATNEMDELNQDPIAGEQPDFESLLDTDQYPEVIAVVNGVELEKEMFVAFLEQQVMTMLAQGMDIQGEQFAELLGILEQQIIDQFVDQQALNHAAIEAGMEATEEEIDQELEVVIAQNQLESEEQLVEILEQQGMSLEELREEIAEFVKREKYIDQQIETPTISDEDIEAEYDRLIAEVEASEEDVEIPALDEAEEDIRAYLASQLEEEQFAQLLIKLREESDVTINI